MEFKYPKKLDKIFDKLLSNDAKPVIVGGFVRDTLLDIDSNDIDIEVYNINSFEKLESILQEFGSVNSVGKSFGVCKLDFNECKLDFTLPRIDSKVSHGHCGFTIEIDSSLNYKSASSRRDFTINTIGYDISSKTLLDPFNGVDDLKNRVLKVVDATKFLDDPLRVLRAMQFCARFELLVDKSLIDICKNMCDKDVLKELPNERIFEEFNKLFLKSKKPSIGLVFLKNINALEFFNELKLEEKEWQFTLDAIDRCEGDIYIYLASLCYKIDSKNLENFLSKITNQKSILRYIKSFYHVAFFIQTNKSVLKYSIVKDIDLDNLELFLKAIDIREDKLTFIKNIKPIVHGKDLVSVGFKPSKEFSQILQLVYEIQLLKL